MPSRGHHRSDGAKPSPLGLRVKAAREALGISGNELESKAGLSGGTISRLERGERQELTSSRLAAVAKVLGTTPDFLLHGAPGRPILGQSAEKLSDSTLEDLHESIDDLLMGWFTRFPNLKKALDFENRWQPHVIAAALLYGDDCLPKEWPARLDAIESALHPLQGEDPTRHT